ncbi:MAG TPA: hypothetical protein VMV45_08915 [Casimicrobiaceae bacterium]|nr:hypothetical protein [Casimicrobiaceae bacterium]
MSLALGEGDIALLLSLVEPLELPDMPDEEELLLGMLELLALPLGELLELDEVSDEPVDDGAVEELLEDGELVEGDVVDGDVVVLDELDDGDGGVLSLRWHPARAPSIRTTPSAAQAFLFMKPPVGIENGSGKTAPRALAGSVPLLSTPCRRAASPAMSGTPRVARPRAAVQLSIRIGNIYRRMAQ